MNGDASGSIAINGIARDRFGSAGGTRLNFGNIRSKCTTDEGSMSNRCFNKTEKKRLGMKSFSNKSAFPKHYRTSRRCSSNVIKFERECTREQEIIQIGVTSRSTPPVPRKKNSNVNWAELHNFSMFALVCGDASSWTEKWTKGSTQPVSRRKNSNVNRAEPHIFFGMFLCCAAMFQSWTEKWNKRSTPQVPRQKNSNVNRAEPQIFILFFCSVHRCFQKGIRNDGNEKSNLRLFDKRKRQKTKGCWARAG